METPIPERTSLADFGRVVQAAIQSTEFSSTQPTIATDVELQTHVSTAETDTPERLGRLRRLVGASAAVLALSGGATLLDTLPAAADIGIHRVYNTGGEGLWLHPDSPTLHSRVSDLMPNAGEFDPACFSIGDYVNGDNVWQYGTDTATGNKGMPRTITSTRMLRQVTKLPS